MAIFGSKKQPHEEVYKIVQKASGGQNILGALFAIWGVGGFLICGVTLMSMPSNVGVGTSAYVTAICVFWIGGMILFGIGALIGSTQSKVYRPVDDEYGDVRVDPHWNDRH